MALIRIHTENKNRNWVESLIGLHFPYGFSINEQVGYWRGGFERSLCIEIDTLNMPYLEFSGDKVADIVAELKTHNKQEAVLVQEIESNSYLA